MKRTFAILGAPSLLALSAQCQFLLSGGLNYSQNFDSLAKSSTGTRCLGTDNLTPPGWFASRAHVSCSGAYGTLLVTHVV